VRRVDGDTARFFFGSSVDLIIGREFVLEFAAAITLVIAAVSDVLPWST
jgi:hypothetical protein